MVEPLVDRLEREQEERDGTTDTLRSWKQAETALTEAIAGLRQLDKVKNLLADHLQQSGYAYKDAIQDGNDMYDRFRRVVEQMRDVLVRVEPFLPPPFPPGDDEVSLAIAAANEVLK